MTSFDPVLAITRAVASLCVTLGLMVLLAWAWRRYGQPFSHKLGLAGQAAVPTNRLTVLETKRLTPTTTLHLIRDGDTEHLLATTAAQTTLIHTRPAAPSTPKSAKLKS